MFVDDLFLFTHGDRASVGILKSCLDRFWHLSSLVPNSNKNDCFVSYLNKTLRAELYLVASFKHCSLPIWYLGVPLLMMKLSYNDCRVILDKVHKQVRGKTSCYPSTVVSNWSSQFIQLFMFNGHFCLFCLSR